MILKTIVVGPFQCNCTILACERTKEAVVIDAGDEWPRIEQVLHELKVTLKYSIHTHAHLDHIGAVSGLKRLSPTTKIALHSGDQWLYENLQMQGQLFGVKYDKPPAVDQFINDGEDLCFGDHKLNVIHTPGHSPGGVCLSAKEGLVGAEPFLFSGDTLFRESIGRTDLWGADHNLLLKSIKQRLFALPEETGVLPGHGERTTLAFEKRENPFLR